MPEVRIPAMTDEQRQRFQQALLNITLANADGHLSFRLQPDGTFQREVSKRGFWGESINEDLDLVEQELREGRAVAAPRRGGADRTPIIREAEIVRRHHYPIAHMTPEQEEEFHRDIREINEAMMRQDCGFESLLDDEARIYFRYHIADGVEEGSELLDRIHRVVDHLHSGRALRIEMPDDSVMLMPRWRLQKHEKATA